MLIWLQEENCRCINKRILDSYESTKNMTNVFRIFFHFKWHHESILKNNIYRVGFPTHENFKTQTQYVGKVLGGCCPIKRLFQHPHGKWWWDRIIPIQLDTTHIYIFHVFCQRYLYTIYVLFVGKSKFGITISSCVVLYLRTENQILE